MEKEIAVKYHAGITRLEKISVGDWIDLRASQTTTLEKGQSSLIPLGISMQLPEGYEAHVLPRSSTFKKFGIILANHQGIIDNSYNGDNDIWLFNAIAMRDTTINFDDRICQFRIVKNQPTIKFTEVETLGNDDRGGFGSTGV